MIKVLPNERPKFSGNDNVKKTEYIARVIENTLLPRYGKEPGFQDFFDFLASDDAFRASGHFFRYLNTYGMMLQSVGELVDRVIVETGSASPITVFLARQNQCFRTESDLRMTLDVNDEFADVVISFEVIEHLKDAPEKQFSEVMLFQGSGVHNFAAELQRITKRGGSVVLTTPNCCSYRAIECAMQHKPPYVFRLHVREYSKDELLEIFSEFELRHHFTMFNFFMLGEGSKKWDAMFDNLGFSTEDRGDDHFLHFARVR